MDYNDLIRFALEVDSKPKNIEFEDIDISKDNYYDRGLTFEDRLVDENGNSRIFIPPLNNG